MDVEELVNYGIPEEAIDILLKRGIKKLNPVQEEAVRKGFLDGENLVVSSPTASGKTLIGELGIVKAISMRRKAIYLVPLKALASEKYSEFKQWEDIGARIGISTGDYESPGEYLGRYNVIIATYERFDSLLRLKPSWLRRIGVVVIDELHMVGDSERGPILEMIIARLKRMGVQVIGLSATIGNSSELARWLDAELVLSNWRPVELIEGVYDPRAKTIVFNDGRVEKIIHRLSSPLLSIVLQSITSGYQVLAFIHNRRRTEKYALELLQHLNLLAHLVDQGRAREYIDRLRSESPSRSEAEKLGNLLAKGVAYHHAGLSGVARRIVEEAFRERVVRAVFATPTLAAGVNLPARRVLVSIKRYNPHVRRNVEIPVFEYKQMAGRAGRPSYDPYGEAIIYDARSKDHGFRKYVYGRIEPVSSKMASERALRIHVLALIAGGEAGNLDSLVDIFENTLFYHQYRSKKYLRNELEKIVEELWEWEMVSREDSFLAPTLLGRTITATYLDPLSAHRFLESIKPGEKPGILYLLHLITYTPDYLRSKPYINYRIVDAFEEKAWDDVYDKLIPPPPDSDVEYGFWLQAYVHARLLYDWINEASEDSISEKYEVGPGDLYSAKETAAWISAGLSRISGVRELEYYREELRKLRIWCKGGCIRAH